MRLILCSVALIATLYQPTQAQTRHGSNWPLPPEAADKPAAAPSNAPGTAQTVRMSPTELQHEARELLEMSQSLQLDIDSVNRNLLPKDTVVKLKRIEKLAKHMRGEISP